MREMIGVIIGLVVAYLMCAMLAWDFYPGNWGWLLRGLCLFGMTFFAFFGFGAANASK